MKDEMDGQSAVFGKITRGLDLLDAMNGKSIFNPVDPRPKTLDTNFHPLECICLTL